MYFAAGNMEDICSIHSVYVRYASNFLSVVLDGELAQLVRAWGM